nr:MAG TPA: hypothetical protein [Caudoviricetes sp.]
MSFGEHRTILQFCIPLDCFSAFPLVATVKNS